MISFILKSKQRGAFASVPLQEFLSLKTCLECGGYKDVEHEVGFEVLPLFAGAPQTLRSFAFVIRTHLVVLIILYKTNSENSLFLVK